MDFALHRDFTELASLAEDWNELLSESVTHIPFLRHEYLSAWWTTRGGGEWPESELAVVTAHHGNRLIGVAPVFSARNRDGNQALLLLGSIEISDYLDILARRADCFATFFSRLACWPRNFASSVLAVVMSAKVITTPSIRSSIVR